MKLQHEDGSNYRSNQVTVHYDNRIVNLDVDENGTVTVENQQEAEQLLEQHGKFFKVNDDEEAPNVLEERTVTEVKEYVAEIDDLNRLIELREMEERKTARNHIDQRISKVRAEEEEDEEEESVENQDEQVEDDEPVEDDGEDEEESPEADDEEQ